MDDAEAFGEVNILFYNFLKLFIHRLKEDILPSAMRGFSVVEQINFVVNFWLEWKSASYLRVD